MEINFNITENTMTIYLKGELDHHTSLTARERIDLKLSTSLQKNIIYDLTGLTFMDSSGIGLVANGYKIVREFGGNITVVTDNEKYVRILKMSKMDELVKLVSPVRPKEVF